MAEPKERRTRRMKRRQRILQAVGVTRTLKCWYSFEISLLRMPRVLTYTEGNTEAPVTGEGVEVRRSPQAVACRKRYVGELGKPQRLPSVGKMSTRHGAIEARRGNPETELCASLTIHRKDRAGQAEKYWQRERPPHAAGVSYQA